MFKSGFVTIIGKPNAGKSSLMNALLGEKLSIITSKAQTTRHRIRGMLNDERYQIIFSDTPGVLDVNYELHRSMQSAIDQSLVDADVILALADLKKPFADFQNVIEKISRTKVSVIAVLNKTDVVNEEVVSEFRKKSKVILPDAEIISVSAKQNENIDALLQSIIAKLPEHAPFFSPDQLTDRSERFIVSEMIREKIFEQFQDEVPYCCEVIINEWKDKEKLISIRAAVIVERESQKGILLGKGGTAVKKLGIASREAIEKFLGRKLFLELTIKVSADWRNDKNKLRHFGYNEK